jgi:Uma2 family endonuclease
MARDVILANGPPLRNLRLAEHHMAMPATTGHRWTADEVRALPEEPGKRFECVDGELLVSPGPRLPHQSAVVLFTRLLDEYSRAEGVGSAFNGPGELELDAYTLVQPDVFVLPLVDGKRAQSQEGTGHPLLFVEVLSPGTARYDRMVKRRRYQRYAVEYWIADLDARLVERWSPETERPEIIAGELSWRPGGAGRALLIDLEALFAETLGER